MTLSCFQWINAEPRYLKLHKGFPEAAQPDVQEPPASEGPRIPAPVEASLDNPYGGSISGIYWFVDVYFPKYCHNRSFDPNINDLRNDRACRKDWILGTVEVTDGLAICIVCSAN